jgi:hypothetical protein
MVKWGSDSLPFVSILEVGGYITDSHPDLISHNVLSHHVSEWIRGGFLAPHCHVRSRFESVCAPIDPISYTFWAHSDCSKEYLLRRKDLPSFAPGRLARDRDATQDASQFQRPCQVPFVPNHHLTPPTMASFASTNPLILLSSCQLLIYHSVILYETLIC